MDQLTLTAVTAIGSAFIGGGAWSFAGTWLTQKFRRKETDEERQRREHRECIEKLAVVERRLEIVEHHHTSLVPRWIKNANGRLLWVNGAAMVTIFGPLGLTRDQVEGRTFRDLLDLEGAREIERLDRIALLHPGRAVSTFLQLHLQLPKMHIVKVAGIGRDSELIFEGYAYCDNDPAEIYDRSGRRQEEQKGLSFLRVSPPEQDPPAALPPPK